MSGKVSIILIATSTKKALALENIFSLQLFPPIKQNNVIKILEKGLRSYQKAYQKW